MMERAALLDPANGEFLADDGGTTLKLHRIKIFNATTGEDQELTRWMEMFPHLKRVNCKGKWCQENNVDNSA